MNLELIRELALPRGGKIILLVLDGLGSMPIGTRGETLLEAADTPHLDRLAKAGIVGFHEPVGSGITPGSGPGHLALFGYDPVRFRVGRGVLSALGIDFPLEGEDVAARGNFATVDEDDIVTDRRAGRIGTDRCRELCERLDGWEHDGVEFHVRPVKGHRFLLVLRGEDLSPAIDDTDPHRSGMEVGPPRAGQAEAERTAKLLGAFVEHAREELSGEDPANGMLLRGFARRPQIPPFPEVTRMRSHAIAAYPMYRGVSRLLGLEVHATADDLDEELGALRKAWNDGEFFFFHVKQPDAAGEDGDFERKIALLEEADRRLPEVLDLHPDVLLVTGDHSTPAGLGGHSWHPVPVLLHAPATVRPDPVDRFHPDLLLQGALGPRFPGPELMPLALAHAGRLDKFGA